MKKIIHSLSALAVAGQLFSAITLHAAGVEPGFTSLFNGRDLTGWKGDSRLWSVRDGAITGETKADPRITHNTFLVYTGANVANFELRFSYRIVHGNSGVQYRSKVLSQGEWGPIVGGYQADFEAGKTYSGILYDERGVAGGRGIMAGRGQKVVWDENCKKQVVGSLGKSEDIQARIKSEDWNDYVVIANGNHLQHFINGQQTVDVIDNCAAKRLQSGVLALQVHQGPPMIVQFKNMRIKNLKATAATKKIVLVAGRDSHGADTHAHSAGCALFKACLDKVPGIQAEVYTGGWPKDGHAFDDADAIVVYSDGGGGHPFIQGDRLKILAGLMKQGIGLGAVHYAVEVPKDRGGKQWLNWMGGYFETDWSVNPHWEADFKSLPHHPVARGVKPFKIQDEWYYHMRFQDGMKGVTPILSALPPAATLKRKDGPHSNNPAVRAAVLERKEPQHLLWVYERPNGGRGFGFTGGHFHKNWANPNFRKAVLNAIVWIAGAEVPANGVEVDLTPEQVMAFLKTAKQ